MILAGMRQAVYAWRREARTPVVLTVDQRKIGDPTYPSDALMERKVPDFAQDKGLTPVFVRPL
ncbi:hypothetical protein [Vibrio nigripulchritudo]|uniref:hypothetical protein n=1 Tax=Vibrio nigripulchritudo TaxID=28173 RepID=UPI002492D7C6|nr:hypothetical protein [Vibrio nigripulchritudo]BDU41079.1 hypothetical protein TUMSATVNIG2_55480 [Vibrio nigripulchritudo]BDU46820.1 hypothetical protein TUMSATVNIG3_56180 [Vibrio nigripulchritudo]